MSSTPNFDLESYLEVEEREKKKFQSRTLLTLFRFLIQHPMPLFTGLSMVLLGTLATLLEPRIFGYAIDDAIVPRDWIRLRGVSLLFLLVTIIRVASTVFQSYFFELLGQRVTQDLRLRLFAHLQSLPMSTYDQNPAGRLLTRVTNDIAALNEMFSAGFLSMLTNFLLVVGILSWLLILDLRLGLIASSVFPILSAFSVYFSKRLQIAYRDSRSKLSALNSFLAENLSGMKIIHLFNRQELHLARFQRLNQWYADAQVSSIRVFALFQPTITITAGISIALLIVYGGKATVDGTIKLGVLVAFFSYSMSLFQPVREIADKWNTFLSGMASAERIFSLLAWKSEMDVKDLKRSAATIEGLQGKITFENVWFAYEKENWVLKDFCLEILPGERIGIVGHTGAGKSTLIGLLLRFYEPQKGRILLDGQDIRDYDKRSLRASIGIVQQDVFLFSGTFQENVTFWNSLNGERAQSFLDSIGFHKARSSEPLQERGSNLSLGERQILAFARALAKNPKIWILDEATSNLDSETEKLLQKSFEKESIGKTTLLVAHRLSTVRNADRILVLHKGCLLEDGHHIELMKKNGLYARLYRFQQADQNLSQSQSHFV